MNMNPLDAVDENNQLTGKQTQPSENERIPYSEINLPAWLKAALEEEKEEENHTPDQTEQISISTDFPDSEIKLPEWLHEVSPEPHSNDSKPTDNKTMSASASVNPWMVIDETTRTESTAPEPLSHKTESHQTANPDEPLTAEDPDSSNQSEETMPDNETAINTTYLPQWQKAFSDIESGATDQEPVAFQSSMDETTYQYTYKKAEFDIEALLEDLHHDQEESMLLDTEHSYGETSPATPDDGMTISTAESRNIVQPVTFDNDQTKLHHNPDDLFKEDSISTSEDSHLSFEAWKGILEESQLKIRQNIDIPAVIQLLEQHSKQFSSDPLLWQTLGDAFFKNNQIQKAIDAYTKAEQVLD